MVGVLYRGMQKQKNGGELMNEIWKDAKGWEGCYQVSNLGNVRSIDRYVRTNRGALRIVRGNIKRLHQNKDGYLTTHFRNKKDGKDATVLVHRIVAETFIERVNGKNAIDHINGVRADNRVKNLRWCTNKENSNFPLARKNISKGIQMSLRTNPVLMQLKIDNIKKINATPINVYKNGIFFKKFSSQRDAERYLGYTQGVVNKYLKGKMTNKDGFTFEYIR